MYFVCFLSFAFVFLVGAAAGEQSHVCWRRPHSQLDPGEKDDHGDVMMMVRGNIND